MGIVLSFDHYIANDRSFTRVGENEVVEAEFLRRVSHGGEEAQQQFAEVVRSDTIEIVFPFAARLDQPGDPHEERPDARPRRDDR